MTRWKEAAAKHVRHSNPRNLSPRQRRIRAFELGCDHGVKVERERILGMLKESFPKDSDGPYRCGEWFAEFIYSKLREEDGK